MIRYVWAIVVVMALLSAGGAWINSTRAASNTRKMEGELVEAKLNTRAACSRTVVWVVTPPEGSRLNPVTVIAGVVVTPENQSWFEFAPGQHRDLAVYYNAPGLEPELLTVKNRPDLCGPKNLSE